MYETDSMSFYSTRFFIKTFFRHPRKGTKCSGGIKCLKDCGTPPTKKNEFPSHFNRGVNCKTF